MKTPRQLFCEQKEIATSAMEAVASTPVQRAMAAAFAQVAWALGNDAFAHAKLAGARAFMETLGTVGVPQAETKVPRVGFLTDPDELVGGNGKGAKQ